MKNIKLFEEFTKAQSLNEAGQDFMARHGNTNINLKKGYKHHTEDELTDLYNKIGDLVKTLKVKDVTLIFESEINESHFKVGDRVKIGGEEEGQIISLDKEHGEPDEPYYEVESETGEITKRAPNELEKLDENLTGAEKALWKATYDFEKKYGATDDEARKAAEKKIEKVRKLAKDPSILKY